MSDSSSTLLDARAAAAHREGRSWEASTTGGFWSPGPYLLLIHTLVDREQLAQLTRYTLVTEEGIRRFEVSDHCFTDDAVRGMLAEAGFSVVELHRGVLPHTGSQDVMFAVAAA